MASENKGTEAKVSYYLHSALQTGISDQRGTIIRRTGFHSSTVYNWFCGKSPVPEGWLGLLGEYFRPPLTSDELKSLADRPPHQKRVSQPVNSLIAQSTNALLDIKALKKSNGSFAPGTAPISENDLKQIEEKSPLSLKSNFSSKDPEKGSVQAAKIRAEQESKYPEGYWLDLDLAGMKRYSSTISRLLCSMHENEVNGIEMRDLIGKIQSDCSRRPFYTLSNRPLVELIFRGVVASTSEQGIGLADEQILDYVSKIRPDARVDHEFLSDIKGLFYKHYPVVRGKIAD